MGISRGLIIVLACVAFSACQGPSDQRSKSRAELDLASQAGFAVVRLDARELARVAIESADIDRVEVARSTVADRLAIVVHHGRFGGASLFVADLGSEPRLTWRTAPSDDLSAPRFSPDGSRIALVRRRPARLDPTTHALVVPGELWLVDAEVRRATRRRSVAPEQVDRPLGWDAAGRLLAAYRPGDASRGERVAQIDSAHARWSTLPIVGASAHVLRLDLGDDGRLSFLKSAQRFATAPAPWQRVERVVLEPTGETAAGEVAARFVGTLPELTRALPPIAPRPDALRSAVAALPMPYVHQVYDTPNSFNGHWACGPTSTLMAIQHFGRLPKKPITVNANGSHTSNYGAYVSQQYKAFGTTFKRMQTDASGKAAYGGYGHCTENGGAWAWRMQDYAKKHDLSSGFSGSASFSAIKGHLAAGKVVVLSTQLTSAGHIITVKGTTASGKLIVNDPYGDRNKPSYPNPAGKGAVYSWSQVKAKWYITVYGKMTPPPKPDYKATRTGKSAFPATMTSGERVEIWIRYRNDGAASWTAKTRLGTAEPRDRTSVFAADSWLAPNRPAAAQATKPAAEATLRFTLKAPPVCERKTYKEAFNLLHEGAAWFSDAKQGGPADDALVLSITVDPKDGDGDGANDCDDCDDADPAAYPGATEACNGKDDNCDGEVDEGCPAATPGDLGGGGDAGASAGSDAAGVPPPSTAPSAANLSGGCAIARVRGGSDLGIVSFLLLGWLRFARSRRRSASSSTRRPSAT